MKSDERKYISIGNKSPIMLTRYESKILELEAKYGWIFYNLRLENISSTEIVKYAYGLRATHLKKWGTVFLFGVCVLAFSIISFFKNYNVDIMFFVIGAGFLMISHGASYLITGRKVFKDLLALASEFDSII